MNKFVEETVMQRLGRVAEALRKNRMEAHVVKTAAEVAPLVKSLVPKGASVASGGSESLAESGVAALLAGGDYNFIDRNKYEDKRRAYIDAYGADFFFCSSNAVTEKGELYNVDGNSNRISMIAYGPENVIMVVGANKVVKDLAEAESRVKTHAAPPNAKRLSCATYCREAGVCMGLGGEMTDGCASEGRICCSYLVCGPQRHKDRIKVILVGESLGF